MTPRTHGPRAFTLIEMVIALALAVVMVVAVQSATVSLASVARRQKAMAANEACWLRFEDLLRRDLRGWRSGKAGAGGPNGKDEGLLLEVETTTDALTAWNGEMAEAQRATKIRYVVRASAGEFVLARSEGPADAGTEVPLVQALDRPKVEFLQPNGKWGSQIAGSGRPLALRLTLGKKALVVRL